jgi:hypothetical protein
MAALFIMRPDIAHLGVNTTQLQLQIIFCVLSIVLRIQPMNSLGKWNATAMLSYSSAV